MTCDHDVELIAPGSVHDRLPPIAGWCRTCGAIRTVGSGPVSGSYTIQGPWRYPVGRPQEMAAPQLPSSCVDDGTYWREKAEKYEQMAREVTTALLGSVENMRSALETIEALRRDYVTVLMRESLTLIEKTIVP